MEEDVTVQLKTTFDRSTAFNILFSTMFDYKLTENLFTIMNELCPLCTE